MAVGEVHLQPSTMREIYNFASADPTVDEDKLSKLVQQEAQTQDVQSQPLAAASHGETGTPTPSRTWKPSLRLADRDSDRGLRPWQWTCLRAILAGRMPEDVEAFEVAVRLCTTLHWCRPCTVGRLHCWKHSSVAAVFGKYGHDRHFSREALPVMNPPFTHSGFHLALQVASAHRGQCWLLVAPSSFFHARELPCKQARDIASRTFAWHRNQRYVGECGQGST